MRTNIILTFVTLTVMCVLGNIISAKIKTSVPTFELTCPNGTVLKGRRDWTDQQPVGTSFAGFSCCPVGYNNLMYLNENYFCCQTDAGSCMSNSCQCETGELKGGVVPSIKIISK